MIPFIRQYIFGGAEKNAAAPYIFIVLGVYALLISGYTAIFFSTNVAVVRCAISFAIIAVYTGLERSRLDSEVLAFLSPFLLISCITFGAIYFEGDFLVFTYNIGCAMISLCYMRPRGLAAYIVVVGVGQAIILLVFNQNLLGASFTTIYNYLFFLASIGICFLVYEFCKSYTQILSNLAEAKNEAHRASLAKGAFLSNMSHEIRTPMNAIVGMTAIGKTSHDIGQAHYALSKIEDASAHLLGIINDVLDMSKIESGKFDLSFVEFSFDTMLKRVVNVISFRVNEKEQKFALHVDEKIPPVLIGDNQRLAQVITNLLGNAVKFTPVGGKVCLNASLLREEDDICEIKIEVTDSGIGISSEQQARLFQAFQQAEKNTVREYGGTGLGLAISKILVEMMGGRIWVDSELGKGATFAFTVHIKRSAAQEYDLPGSEINWTNVRILAVDDDQGILGYIKSFVEKFGAQCDTAQCGADALKFIRQYEYDIYFIDWKLSDTDGLDLAREIKSIYPNSNNLVVSMISTVECSDIEESAKKAGVDRFLAKPLFPSVIAEILNAFLGIVRKQIDTAVKKMPVDYAGKYLLLVEDVEINREIVLSLLGPTNLGIDCAEDGEKAVSMVSAAPDKYDIIFMDVQMPKMDGYTATRLIRALDAPNLETIPIIAMTANVFREDIERCLEAGMNGHLGKPLDMDMVFGLLKKYLK